MHPSCSWVRWDRRYNSLLTTLPCKFSFVLRVFVHNLTILVETNSGSQSTGEISAVLDPNFSSIFKGAVTGANHPVNSIELRGCNMDLVSQNFDVNMTSVAVWIKKVDGQLEIVIHFGDAFVDFVKHRKIKVINPHSSGTTVSRNHRFGLH